MRSSDGQRFAVPRCWRRGDSSRRSHPTKRSSLSPLWSRLGCNCKLRRVRAGPLAAGSRDLLVGAYITATVRNYSWRPARVAAHRCDLGNRGRMPVWVCFIRVRDRYGLPLRYYWRHLARLRDLTGCGKRGVLSEFLLGAPISAAAGRSNQW